MLLLVVLASARASSRAVCLPPGNWESSVILAYPYYSEVFEIYTDDSSKQLGAVITQKNRPIAFFSRKFSVTQHKYSVAKIELLAIVETLEEFKGMLWGQTIKVFTNHKNT